MQRAPMILSYEPSEPTGWPAPVPGVGTSLGGNVVAKEFTRQARTYRVELLWSDPVYEKVPADRSVAFGRTLSDGFGAYYEFRYLGGLRGPQRFDVRSYSVFVAEEPWGVFCGADLYVVHQPGRSAGGTLRWIQVARSSGRPSIVDNAGRANPFYVTGGRTSVFGRQQVGFSYRDGVPVAAGPDGTGPAPHRFVAELFLVEDTGRATAAGLTPVNVLGGIRYGWQVREVTG